MALPNFEESILNRVSEKSEAILGKCNSMCPQDEVLMREKTRMVHILEVSTSGEKKLVKCYSRPAADSVMVVPSLLRPYKVLSDTVTHLLFVVTKRRDVSAPVIYDFVSDRLRAVRQDMTIQRLPDYECAFLLEPMIRFYVYFGYKLCQHPIKEYDPTLNQKYLLECLKWYLGCYEAVMNMPETKNPRNLSKIALRIGDWDFPDGTNRKPVIRTRCDRPLMESLYILCNLDNIHPMARYWTLPKELQRNQSINLAYQIAAANLRGNYVQVCRLLEKLCPLTFCALCLHLPVLQRRALLTMSAAYRQHAVPAAALQRWLRLGGAAAAARACAHYGLPVAAGAVHFRRTDFRIDAPLHELIKPLQLEKSMDLSIDHIFNYKTH